MRYLILTACLTLLAGCTGVQVPSDAFIYERACEVLEETENVPEGAEPAPIEEARVGVGKNAAMVDLPYSYTAEDGARKTAGLTVRFKRVARTWTVIETFPTPFFAPGD